MVQSTSQPVDLCILGAGPIGGTLACLAANAGLRVAIIDHAALPPMERPEFDGRAYAIAAGSKRLLEQAGLWHALPLPPCPIRTIKVTDGKPGRAPSPLGLYFRVSELAEAEPEAAFGWMVEARSLRRAINGCLHANPAIAIHAPAKATITRSADTARIETDQDACFTAPLVIAADGRGSRLRHDAAIAVTRLSYGQTAIVCAIAHEKPHEGVALEHFLPAGPFAALPMSASEAGEHISALVWTESDKDAPVYLGLDDAEFARQIARRLGPGLGALRPVGRRWSYPLSALHAHRYTDCRLALVGDAAHGIHPIAGQGLNLGFQDLQALVPLLSDARANAQDLGGSALLARYQRLRRGENLAMLAMTDGLDRLFSTGNPAIRLVRDLGLAGVDRVAPVKRFFMRRAMGL